MIADREFRTIIGFLMEQSEYIVDIILFMIFDNYFFLIILGINIIILFDFSKYVY